MNATAIKRDKRPTQVKHRGHTTKYAKWKKPEARGQILYDSTDRMSRRGKFTEMESWEQGLLCNK